MTNAISALGNAWANCWPMLLIGGSSNQALNHMGISRPPHSGAGTPLHEMGGSGRAVELIPRYIATAVRHAIAGRPGPVYLDLPGDIIASRIEESQLEYPPRVEAPTTPQVDPSVVKKALEALRSAHNPSPSLGKGPPGHAPRSRCGASLRRRRCLFWHRLWVGVWCRTIIP